MVTDGDDQRSEEGSRGEKICLMNLLALVRGVYDEDETRTVQGKDSVSKELCLFKQKSDECNATNYYHDNASSSSSSSSLSSVVSQEPIRVEPIREVKVQRKRPVKGERGVTPEWLVNLMGTLNGVDAKLVIDKMIEKSDVNANQGRLLIPFNQIVENDFLNEAELNLIDEHQRDHSHKGVGVIVVASDGRRWNANIRRWNMNCPNYSLCSGWNDVVRENNLKDKIGQILQLWSFHSSQDGKLYLAFFHQPPAPEMHAASSSSMALDIDSGNLDLNIPLAPLEDLQERHDGRGTSLESVRETTTTVDLELRLGPTRHDTRTSQESVGETTTMVDLELRLGPTRHDRRTSQESVGETTTMVDLELRLGRLHMNQSLRRRRGWISLN
ncbi:unnamed protein product [Eruca vesicaria subsp. sativa]|uniref:TF-B3 domain-containing protein n=1 Tax=Eruca vesicaria subsp. sativa TaxID=29727 RepID=A0ABC8KVY1_ERUVS|nr:unnamed protein product [Eruca vesicaria subsp. sativa]